MLIGLKTTAPSRLDEIIDYIIPDYLECAIWISCDEEEMPLDTRYSVKNLTDQSIEVARSDIKRFIDYMGLYLTQALFIECEDDKRSLGHDLWLTQNRHGTGFWSGRWPEPLASILTQAAQKLIERNVFECGNGLDISLE